MSELLDGKHWSGFMQGETELCRYCMWEIQDHLRDQVCPPYRYAKETSVAPSKEDDDAKVNPRHYSDWGLYSGIVIIRRWNEIRGKMGFVPVSFNVGNAIKYIQRAGTNPGESEIVDLKKAVWYLNNRIHELDPKNEPDPAKVDV